MTVVVFQVIALIFQGVEGFVLDFPARTASVHDRHHVVGSEGEIGDAGIQKGFSVRVFLPVINKVDLQVSVFMVELLSNLVYEHSLIKQPSGQYFPFQSRP